MHRTAKKLGIVIAAVGVAGCASGERRFPLREPMWRDTDLASVNARCHKEPTKKDPNHVSCAPAQYDSAMFWDGQDNLIFRPLSEALRLTQSGEAVNVNSVDEVPDSAWFTNRIGKRAISTAELRLGACTTAQLLDPAHAADGSWIVDKGKTEGETPGFRIVVPGKGKYLLKAETLSNAPEREAASSVIGAAVYWATGYNTACEQVIYVRPSIFKLKPGLVYRKNDVDSFGDLVPFDQKVLDGILANSTKREGLVRLSASAWIPGYGIGEYRYEGTREDDPNDVIPHEDRRELRAMRLLAAWIDRHDAREGNTLDSWFADAHDPPDSSPGHVIHYQLDTSEALGGLWAWDPISRRLGRSYVLDWGDIVKDYFTLGIPLRPWDTVAITPGQAVFGYFDVKHFDPAAWKNEYPNAAFSRMTERDGAWMARILSHFSPEMVRTLAEMSDFSNPGHTDYLAQTLEGRLERILARYLTRLSPIADVHMEGADTVCGVDLAELRGVRPAASFQYKVTWDKTIPLRLSKRPGAGVCVTLPHFADDRGPRDDAPERYVRITLVDGVAHGPLVVDLYDLGPSRGYHLAGVERP
ncbi:MAG TPA: hypothetical protein VLM85_24205 [Polyangiaceae bacterium]|nr:hypothetical protein [Polyangiaceae bacterium]